MYRKYKQRIDSLRKGIILESDARQREAEEMAIDEIAGTSDSLNEKGKIDRNTKYLALIFIPSTQ